jgi:hypothetical protein
VYYNPVNVLLFTSARSFPMDKPQKAMLLGGAIGAFLGAGAAYLLSVAPTDDDDEEKPITAAELITITGAAATIIRRLDDLRRKL